MIAPRTDRPERNRITTDEEARRVATDALRERGEEPVVTTTPHRTRATWVVPAVSDGGAWRVHVDPRTHETRVVEC
ncbi:hypothetical protein [Natronorarus salvus]|uniref:hypothetical protein n=1 Tax=Natronorarus salvus TaxID=3117733 RepID=UPI002F26303D